MSPHLRDHILNLLRARPDTSHGLARRATVTRRRVQCVLRELREAGEVQRHPSWYGQFAYTWVYKLAEGSGGGSH